MRIVKPNAEFIPQEKGLEGIYKQIEVCGRVCYKSEDKITDSSAQGFVERMIKSNHTAMLEHGTVSLYLEVNPDNAFKSFEYPLARFTAPYNWSDVVGNIGARYRGNPYSKVFNTGDASCRRTFVTTNYRVLVENDWLDDLQFLCEPTEYHKRRYTIKFTCDRITSQSITRHRKDSFAQESQRVCDYLAEKFGMSVSYVEPCWLHADDYDEFKADLEANEQLYFKWRRKGYPPEMARYFLINGAKTEIIVTAFLEDWQHFFDLRLKGTTGRPHPDIRVLASQAFDLFTANNIVL